MTSGVKLPNRALGIDGPNLSCLTLGTMRLPEMVDGRPVGEFLGELAERGLHTHHSSGEYETHPRYLQALAGARSEGHEFSHIVKMAEPSWDDLDFSPARFEKVIDGELSALGADRIDVVQWMIRTKNPTDDSVRLPILERDADLMRDTFARLKAKSKIGAVACFGYTKAFTETASALGLIDGLTTYYNPAETDELDQMKVLPTIAIRPFAGGSLLESKANLADLLRFALEGPNVASTVVSMSSRKHALELLDLASG